MQADLPTGWRLVRVADIASSGKYACVGGPFGSNLTQKDYVPEPGVPVIRGVNLGSGDSQFNDEGFVYVSESKARTLVQNMARPGDLVFTQRGTLGQVGWIPETARFREYIISQSQMKLTLNPDIADSGFVYGYFRSPVARRLIDNRAITTGVPHINLGILRDFPVPLPPLDEQRRIAGVLGALDDKIEANRRMNASLDALARAVFREQFGRYGPDDTLPPGWHWGTTDELVEVNPSVTLRQGTVARYVGMSELPTKGFEVGQVEEKPYAGGAKFEQGDTLLARITPCLENGKTTLVDFLLDGEAAFGSTEYIVMRPVGTVPRGFAYTLARDDDFRRFVIGHMSGSSGRQRASAGDVARYPIVVPTNDALATFGEVVEPLLDRASANHRQNQALAELRDRLLPKLLSGQLRVRDAETTIQAVS